jgi:hypothetical protein
MKLCLFSVDDTEKTFGVDAACVVEFLRDLPMTRVPLVSPRLLGLLNIRGEVVPVFLPPRMDAMGAEGIRQLQRQGSYLVLEGGDSAGRFALPASRVDLADGEHPGDSAAPGEWLFQATTSLGREYDLIDVEALVGNLHSLVRESSPQPALAG